MRATIGQYNGQGVYCGLGTASSVFLISLLTKSSVFLIFTTQRYQCFNVFFFLFAILSDERSFPS